MKGRCGVNAYCFSQAGLNLANSELAEAKQIMIEKLRKGVLMNTQVNRVNMPKHFIAIH